MNSLVQLVRFFPIDSKNLFAYFVQPNLLKKWLPSDAGFMEVRPYKSIVMKDGTRFEFIPSAGGTRICVFQMDSMATEFTWHQRLGSLISLINDNDRDEGVWASA